MRLNMTGTPFIVHRITSPGHYISVTFPTRGHRPDCNAPAVGSPRERATRLPPSEFRDLPATGLWDFPDAARGGGRAMTVKNPDADASAWHAQNAGSQPADGVRSSSSPSTRRRHVDPRGAGA